MRTYLILLWLVLSLPLLGACSKVETPAEEIVMEQQPCSGNDVPAQYLPEGSAWTWLGITVGESTEQDIRANFGEPELTRLWPENQAQVCIYVYRDDFNTFRVWLAGSKVVGLEFGQFYPHPAFHMAEVPLTFEQAKGLYGRAELVGYSEFGYGIRSVAWIAQGVQAEISIHADGTPIGIIRYFTPMTESEFNDSLWAGLVLSENPTLHPTSDLRDNAPKDPFEW